MDITIEIHEQDKASVMNMLHAMALNPKSKMKGIKKSILLYTELTEEQVEEIKDKLRKSNRENKLTIQ